MRALAVVKPAALVDAGPLTVAALMPRFLTWLEFVRERSESTVMAYRQDLESFAAFLAERGVTDPAAITYQMIEAYMAWLRRARGNKASTANRGLHSIRAFFTYCLRERLVEHNAASSVALLKAPRRLPKYLSIREQERLLTVLIPDRTPLGQRNLAMVGTLLFCGLRVSELVTLRMDQVDLGAKVLRVIGKGDKERELFIAPRLRGFLRAYFSDGRPALLAEVVRRGVPDVPWVFVGSVRNRETYGRLHEPLLTRSIHHFVRYVVGPAVGRKNLHPHALRHSFASRLRERGAALELISGALGHESLQTTMIYAHITTTKQKADIAKYLKG